MNKQMLRRSVQGLPSSLQRVLGNERLRNDIRSLLRCKALHPDSAAIHGRLMSALADANRRREALRLWREGSRGSAKRSSALCFHRAHWAVLRHKYSEAEKYLRLCLRSDRGYFGATAQFWRAEMLHQMGEFTASRKALAHVPEDHCEWYFMGHETWSKADLAAKLAEYAANDA